VAEVYERVAPAVANIFDVTLRLPAAGGPQAVEQPEGNGSGFVWDSGAAARGFVAGRGRRGRAAWRQAVAASPAHGMALLHYPAAEQTIPISLMPLFRSCSLSPPLDLHQPQPQPAQPAEGHIVTNYHVLASALSGASGLKVDRGARVARVLLLAPDGVQQAFDGLLVGETGAERWPAASLPSRGPPA
jgi:hypothetical protein